MTPNIFLSNLPFYRPWHKLRNTNFIFIKGKEIQYKKKKKKEKERNKNTTNHRRERNKSRTLFTSKSTRSRFFPLQTRLATFTLFPPTHSSMENYSYTSYPESGGSSPRSREIDFENPPPWEDNNNNPPYNYKLKLMCSYGGKIHPRPHDNQLSYVGGETKILAVERTVKFSALLSKLYAISDAEVCFKYQLPGEDLDALISVTNDDDLEHMMHEYDRLYRASPKPARLRLFLFPAASGNSTPAFTPVQSFGSNASEGNSEREQFVEALNSAPVQSSIPPSTTPTTPNNVDFLFGLEKGMPPHAVAKEPAVHKPEITVPVVGDRAIGSDPIQKHIQDLQRLRIAEEQQEAGYRRKSEDKLAGGSYAGDFYNTTEKVIPATLPGNVQGQVPISAGYWPENHIAGGGVYATTTMGGDQQVYMIQAPQTSMYHAPMGRPVTGPIGQGYYAVQRVPNEVYREQPVYNVLPPQAQSAAAQPTIPQQSQTKMAAYSDGIAMVQSTNTGGVGMTDKAYAQMAYDTAMGRQVYYPPQGAVVAPPQPTAAQYHQVAYGQDMRQAAAFSQEGGNVIPAKVSQAIV